MNYLNKHIIYHSITYTKKVLVLTIIMFVGISNAYSQTKKEWLAWADAAFKTGDYNTAVYFYMQIVNPKKGENTDLPRPYETHPYSPPKKGNKYSQGTKMGKIEDEIANSSFRDQYVIHQIAECYRLSRNYIKAEEWFKKSVDAKSPEYLFDKFWYADAMMKNEKYKEAKDLFEEVMVAADRKDTVIFKQSKVKIAGCFMALDTKKQARKDMRVEEMDSIFNKGTASFAANYYGDQNIVQFSTARDGNTASNDISKIKTEPKFICDIYTAKKAEGKWGNLEKISGPVNSPDHDASGFLSTDQSNFYFTRWSVTNKNECYIYRTRLINDKWLAAEKLNEKINVEGYKTMHPFLNISGDVLYFSSNRPGGYGKMDIWCIQIDEEGLPVGDALNMGPLINTSQDETTPFLHNYTFTLYFSSDGHPGFGGLDVFKTTFNRDDNNWSRPLNMGKPVNSSKDDAYFIFDRSQQGGFMSSDRNFCENCEGGSCMKIFQVTKEPNMFEITGTVYNAETDEVISSALITFKDIHGENEPFYLTTDADGKYYKELTEGMDLFIKAQKKKFFGDATNISTVGLTESETFIKDFFLSPIPEGEIVIPGIEYDYDKATLRPESMKILDQLAEFFELNSDISVEIRSHTDERGSDSYNLKLSEARAQSVVDYLISKGIAKERLVAKGCGETELLIKLAKTEEEHQRNRRTAFRPLKEGALQDGWKGRLPGQK